MTFYGSSPLGGRGGGQRWKGEESGEETACCGGRSGGLSAKPDDLERVP